MFLSIKKANTITEAVLLLLFYLVVYFSLALSLCFSESWWFVFLIFPINVYWGVSDSVTVTVSALKMNIKFNKSNVEPEPKTETKSKSN